MIRLLNISLALLLLADASRADQISFNRDVRPILADRCFHCHGPDADNQESDFRLDSRENALADLGGYAGIVPGDLEQSELHRRIRSQDQDDQMPPADQVRQLTETEKDILDAWIKQGANFEQHWSFIPLRQSIEVPDVGNQWANNAIDRFVYRRAAEHGLVPNRDMPPEKWLRQVTFDLTGLPPTLEEIDSLLKDDSPATREQVVDRLLASVAFAERMASEWLDVARYADSYGYQRDDLRNVWPYRDWVVEAFRSNMPYNQFITQQLAGDLLPQTTPEQTRQQQLATVFNRLHSYKKEGGSNPEEFRTEYVADRTNTFATAFLGMTFECAKCHDHKYDPIKTKEYYQLSSFFSNIDEYGIISFFTDAVPTPAMPLPSPEQTRALAEADVIVDAATAELLQVSAGATSGFDAWLDKREPFQELSGEVAHLEFESLIAPAESADPPATAADHQREVPNAVPNSKPAVTNDQNRIVPGKIGSAILLTGDDAVDLPGVGRFSRDQPFSIALWIKPAVLAERAVIYRRSRGWDDAGHIGYELTQLGGRLSAKLCHFWPGDAIGIETEGILRPDEWFHVTVTYDGSSRAAGLKIFVNGLPAQTRVVQDHLTRQIRNWAGGYDDLAIGTRYRDRGFKTGTVDEFRVFERQLSAIEVAQLYDGRALVDALSRTSDQLTAADRELLSEYYLLAVSEPVAAVRHQLQSARQTWNAAMDAIPAISIMRESESVRENFVLKRGSYENHGESVTPGTPAFLPPFPEDAPRNRLGLAQWLTSSNHPLTARVAVNRYWQLMFGRGLVRTPEDFGVQGQSPTHPDLLDWLARDFMEHGWDVKRLVKMMALSRTYQQSAVVSLDVRNRDPENLWLARGPGQRLTAEMIRDNALAVSGLLVRKTGGPPAKPYDLNDSFKPLAPDEGDGLYRRSLYTLWQRTSPAPVMMTMNANNREVCRVRREVTDSPLQALVLLNSPQFVETSQVLAANLLEKYSEEAELDSLIVEAFQLLTSRSPSPDETKILHSLFDEQLEWFDLHPERAQELKATGHAPASQGVPETRLAAATVLVNAIMNLDESVRHK
jgi:hypothetical protein